MRNWISEAEHHTEWEWSRCNVGRCRVRSSHLAEAGGGMGNMSIADDTMSTRAMGQIVQAIHAGVTTNPLLFFTLGCFRKHGLPANRDTVLEDFRLVLALHPVNSPLLQHRQNSTAALHFGSADIEFDTLLSGLLQLFSMPFVLESTSSVR